MEHDINLNIHYSAPEEVWKKISDVYSSMPYCDENEDLPHWVGENIDLWASVEPGGIQISGSMPKDIWNEWYDTLKSKLTDALGYEIGEPEEGYSFKFWKPFEKKYSDIKSIDNKKIVFNDYSTFFLDEFENIERDITAKPPYFLFRSSLIELWIYFDETQIFSKKKNLQNFRDFQKQLDNIGLKSLDLS